MLLSPYFIYKRSIVHFLLKLFLSLCIRKVGWISQLHWSFLLLIFIPFLCVVLHQVFILIKFYVSIFSYSTVVFTHNNVWFNNTEQCKTFHTHNILNNSFIEIFIIEEKLPLYTVFRSISKLIIYLIWQKPIFDYVYNLNNTKPLIWYYT